MAEIGAGLLANSVTEILKRLIPIVTQKIAGAWVVKGDLKKLEKTLETIQAVIADAEKRQVNEETVRLWLTRLKDAAYDAEDILDEFSYEAMLQSDQKRSLKCKVRDLLVSSSNPLAFPFKMAHKIKDINEKLDAIAKEIRDFGFLTTITSTIAIDQRRELPNQKTVSSVEDSEIVGRENDKVEIVKLLTTNNTSSSSIQYHCQNEKVSVICLVGMGGLGKSTLAQLVYKDTSIMEYFNQKIWVYVSDVFDVFEVLRNIFESITENMYVDAPNKDVLVRKVQEILTGKKYLLVLDDLWNEDRREWERLKSWLNVGAHGSKILITTRLNQVSYIVRGMIPPYKLQKLSQDQCWSIISKKSFSQGGASKTQNMINIGREIAKKCCGLPLVATILGSLMHSRTKESDWRSIKNQNDIWDNSEIQSSIMPILKQSYDNLPSHLKQCFSYCSIFPKNWNINREILIQLWMAEGFLQPSNRRREKSIEDTGNEYFENLLWCSFFQNVVKNDLGDIVTCKMHDLVHDLAQSVVGQHECATVKESGEMANFSEVRRFSLVFDEELSRTFPKTLPNVKKLRTIVGLRSKVDVGLKHFLSNKYLRVLHFQGILTIDLPLIKMKHLRYLNLSSFNPHFSRGMVCDMSAISSCYNLQTLVLSGCANTLKLPRNIGSLNNLRHLDVSYTSIEVLPDSITSLCKLRMLKFDNCPKLKELPREFGQLKHLRSLDLRGTSIRVLPESCTNNLTSLEIVHLGGCKLPKEIKNWTKLRHLTHNREYCSDEMPGIQRLTMLQILHSYVVGKQNLSNLRSRRGIEELHGLNLLEQLRIRNLQNVRGPIGAETANLKGKPNLRKLALYWHYYADDHNDAVVLEALQPNPNLKELIIEGFMGRKLPTWMGGVSSCLVNLVEMTLVSCEGCEQVPALGQLPCLRYLRIRKMYLVKRLGDEFYYSGGEFSGEGVGSSNESTALPISSIFFPSLVYLELEGMLSLEEWIAPPPPPPPPPATVILPLKFTSACSFPLLEKISISGCQNLKIAPTLFPSLKELRLLNGNGGELNSMARGLTSLTSIYINNLPELIYLPRGLLRNNIYLQTLEIRRCEKFQGFYDLDGDRDKDEARPISGALLNNCCSLQSLELENCPVLMFPPDLQGFTTLQRLRIVGCHKQLKKYLPNYPKCLSFIKDLDVDFWKNDDS